MKYIVPFAIVASVNAFMGGSMLSRGGLKAPARLSTNLLAAYVTPRIISRFLHYRCLFTVIC